MALTAVGIIQMKTQFCALHGTAQRIPGNAKNQISVSESGKFVMANKVMHVQVTMKNQVCVNNGTVQQDFGNVITICVSVRGIGVME